jgi:hypothetical protein
MNLVDEIQVCERCERDMQYERLGAWTCECGGYRHAEWLDGPGFCEWLGAQVDKSRFNHAHPSLARRWTDWRNGTAVDFYKADHWMCQLDVNVNDLPDHLWREKPEKKRTAPVAHELRLDAIKRVDNGECAAHVAVEMGVSPKSIANWRKRYAVPA